MRTMRWTLGVLVCVLALAAMPYADVWDVQTENDNSASSDNELTHGSAQIHDLGALAGNVADQDWYKVGMKRQTSFEIVLDATSGDIGFDASLIQRVDGTGTTIQNSALITPGLGYSHSLRWANTTASTSIEFIRVGPAVCGTSCGTDDVYHIRAVETTIGVARFNNAGSQITVLMSQNTTDVPINATYFYWSTAGALLQTGTLTLAPKALNVFNTSSFGTLAGVGGSITIAHDGPYGSLNVKSVAIEPSTGFSFDTPGVYRGV